MMQLRTPDYSSVGPASAVSEKLKNSPPNESASKELERPDRMVERVQSKMRLPQGEKTQGGSGTTSFQSRQNSGGLKIPTGCFPR